MDDEGLEMREFDLDEIPWDDLAFRSTREALRDYIDGTQVTAPDQYTVASVAARSTGAKLP